ncbi:hypothetical protein CDAR_207531 [Caerostris darwini]|uniref:Uncharacterized protein n=1 Tax=Caerostris darwini TaxID=1538125 RepID=A0AAV4VHP3_9ARAC|nr:hypothetical protein CDAR_207531 [Caerostris darwini]
MENNNARGCGNKGKSSRHRQLRNLLRMKMEQVVFWGGNLPEREKNRNDMKVRTPESVTSWFEKEGTMCR